MNETFNPNIQADTSVSKGVKVIESVASDLPTALDSNPARQENLRVRLRSLLDASPNEIQQAGQRAWGLILHGAQGEAGATTERIPAYEVGRELKSRVDRSSLGLTAFASDDPEALEFVALLLAAFDPDVPEVSLGLPDMESPNQWRAIPDPESDTAQSILNNRSGILEYGDFEENPEPASSLLTLAEHVLAALERNQVSTVHLPLGDAAQEVARILCSLPEAETRTAKQLAVAVRGVSEQRIRREVRNELQTWGIENPSRRGYRIPITRRKALLKFLGDAGQVATEQLPNNAGTTAS